MLAVLLLAAFALQVSAVSLANNEAAEGNLRRVEIRSRLRGDRGPLPADVAAKEEFVRKCTVIYTVEEKGHLPIGALEKFCGETKDVVACRMALVREVQEEGRIAGSPQDFCTKIYGWFQTKYGGFCPQQCRKLQCRTTCQWLENQKELQAGGSEMKEGMLVADEDRQELDKMESSLALLREEATKAERVVEQSKVNVQRASDKYNEQQAASRAARKRADDAATESDSMDDARRQLKKDIITAESTLSNLQFELDKLNLKLNSQLERKSKSLSKQVAAAVADHKALNDQVVEQERVLAEVKKTLEMEGSEVKDQEEVVHKQKHVVQDRLTKLQSAKAELEKARRDNEPPEAVAVVEDLVGQQSASHKEEVMTLSQMERSLEKAKELVNRAKTVDARTSDTLSAAKAQQGTAQTIVNDLKAAKDKVDAEATALRDGDIANKQADVEETTKELGGKRKLLEKAEKTLIFKTQLQEDDEAKAREALAAAEQADLQKSNAEDDRDENQNNLEEIAAKLKASLEEAEAKQKAFDKKNEANLVKKHAQKELSRAHRRSMPEIVKQHGLSFIQMLASA